MYDSEGYSLVSKKHVSYKTLNNSPKVSADAWVRLPGLDKVHHQDGPGRADLEGNEEINAFDSHTYNPFIAGDLQKLRQVLSAKAYLEVPIVDDKL